MGRKRDQGSIFDKMKERSEGLGHTLIFVFIGKKGGPG